MTGASTCRLNMRKHSPIHFPGTLQAETQKATFNADSAIVNRIKTSRVRVFR